VTNTRNKRGLARKTRENGRKIKPAGEVDVRESWFKNVSVI